MAADSSGWVGLAQVAVWWQLADSRGDGEGRGSWAGGHLALDFGRGEQRAEEADGVVARRVGAGEGGADDWEVKDEEREARQAVGDL